MTEKPFVKYCEQYNENVLFGLPTSEDRDTIRAFISSKSGKKLSCGRKRGLISKLVSMRKMMDAPFLKATQKDLLKLCDAMGGRYKPNTVNESKAVLKEFFGYLIDEGLTNITPKNLQAIQKEKVASRLSPSDLITPEELAAMLNTTRNPMYQALIALLSESGVRIHEAALLKWGDISFDDMGAVLAVSSTKTHQRRMVRLRDAVPYLSMWKSLYPHYSPEAPVFITERGTTMVYETCRASIARIAAAAGIKKKITPHLFRHTRITELLKMGMREPELKKSLWGSVSTDMLANYEHLSGRDVDEEYKRVLGLGNGESKPKPMMSSIQCSDCSTINREGAKFCMTCGQALTKEAKVEQESTAGKIHALAKNLSKEELLAALEQVLNR